MGLSIAYAALSGEDETYTATARAIFQQRPREMAFVADQVEQFDIHDQSAVNQMERERLAKLQLYYERRYALPEAIRAGAEGRLRDAADHHLRYLAIGTQLGSRPSLGEYLRAAKAQNAAGRFVDAERLYGEAISRFEMQRVNVPLASRWTVARGDKIEAYRGQVYAAAKIYERDPTSKNLDRLLVSDSHLRSRQIADLRGVDPANVSGSAIRRVLAEDEAWLQFSLTESAVVVIALTRKDTVVRVVPAEESAIDTTVRRIARTLQEPGELDLESSSELTELADMLFSGLTEILNTNNRLTVLPSGVLATIPIEVLTHGGGPLGLSHQISYSTSPAIAVHMRGKRRQLRTGGFLGVADPDYRQIEVERHSPSMPTAIGRPRGIERFVPLPETRREVETAARSIGQKAEFLFGAEASEPALRAKGLATRRYLHFATHGVLGSQIPEVREPALVLSQSADSSADHFLTFTEILDFELSADLTVLSACNTGSGEWFAGEGTMGLGRAFLAAGSDAVVMSLWEVDSHATVELMEHFYSELAEGKSNEEALLDARRKVAGLSPIKSKKAEARGIRTNLPVATSYRNPYYWSPFVLLRN